MAGRVSRSLRWPGPPLSSYNEHCHNQKRESSAPFYFLTPPHNPPQSAARSRRSSSAPRLPLPGGAAPAPSEPARRAAPPARRPLTGAPIDHGPPLRAAVARTEGPTQPGSWARAVSGRSAPARSASMRAAWPSAPAAMPWGRPATAARSPPATLATPGSRHRGGIRTDSGSVVTRFAALDTLPVRLDPPSCTGDGVRSHPHSVSAPLGGSRTAHHPPIGAPVRLDRPPPRAARPVRRPLGPRSARQRLVSGRPAQGPPAPAPATPVSSRRGT